jgi:predicted acetyltransferase
MVPQAPTPISATLISATLADRPLIQHLWTFYVYDMGRDCGFKKGWQCPTDLAFIPDDVSPYFTDPTRKAFLVKVGEEIAGFILLRHSDPTLWQLAEFFILGKFQGKGISSAAVYQLWNLYPSA